MEFSMSKTLIKGQSVGFKKKLVAAAVASAMMGVSGFAIAQDENIEEVVVTGIKGSLQRSMDIKREAQGVVDAISAEDIGKFPDTNLAESLQRITGVSIDRANGEGARVTVRGFGPDYNLVTLNGRQMPGSGIEDTSANASRSFDFSNLASEGISGVEVYKTGRASVTSGGIGATINVLTSRPLDNPGLTASVGLKGVMDQSTDKGADITPELSGIYSNTFADDTFGVSLSASYQERESGSKSASTGAGWWSSPGNALYNGDWGQPGAAWGAIPTNDNQVNRPTGADEIYSIPQQLKYDFNEVQRTRTNGQLALQYRPVDSLTTTLDYTYSKQDFSQQFNDLSAWFNWNNNFSNISTEWTDGPIASPIMYAEGNVGSDYAMGAGDFSRTNENKSLGLNVEWLVNDRLTLEFDAHQSEAESRPDGKNGSHNVLGITAPVRGKSTAFFTEKFPVLQIDLSNGESAVNPEDIRISGSSFRSAITVSEIDQYQLKGKLELDNDFTIHLGAASTTVDNRSRFANVQRDSWGGVGEAGDLDLSLWHESGLASKFDLPGSGDVRAVDQTFLFNFEEVRKAAQALYGAEPGTSAPGDCGDWFCPSTDYRNGVDRSTEEETESVYIQLDKKLDLGGRTLNLVGGVRYESTDVTSISSASTFDVVRWVSDNEISLQSSAEREYVSDAGSYSQTLPSLDLSYELTDDLVLRASASKTIARPGYGDIQAGASLNGQAGFNGGSGSRGDAGLLPYESTNFDLSTEWYYGDASYLSVGYFKKDVKNFIGTRTIEENFYGLRNPTDGPRYRAAVAALGNTASVGEIREWIIAQGGPGVDGNVIVALPEDELLDFTVTIKSNQKEATIDGWEFAVQHVFGESGFGAIANYTLVDGDIGYDNLSLGEQFALLGLSDTANLVGFYDKDGLQVRIAYNWRDTFLAGTGHGTGNANPVYVEEYGQVDVNISYDINDNLTVFAEGLNVTDEYTRSHARTKLQLMNMTQLGPRYNIGVRYSF
jgi:TonB-dependent receptor